MTLIAADSLWGWIANLARLTRPLPLTPPTFTDYPRRHRHELLAPALPQRPATQPAPVATPVEPLDAWEEQDPERWDGLS